MRIIVDEPKSHKSFRDMDFRGSKDGDICVIEVKKMEISSLNKRMHLGTNITSLEFYPSERVALTTSSQWGAMVTKLNVSADWKEWQIYLLLWGLFLASAILFYMFFENSDSFWNFPHPSSRLKIETLHGDPTSDEQWSSFVRVDLICGPGKWFVEAVDKGNCSSWVWARPPTLTSASLLRLRMRLRQPMLFGKYSTGSWDILILRILSLCFPLAICCLKLILRIMLVLIVNHVLLQNHICAI
ncbi:SEC12-like protein 1 isoform X3 [Lycium barbarum]|nr:SEC12-like protein 1 isoform X3 [Lycium barbarum]XP_060184998.1 SEC12-like protein 1 isoform X3 [Lycium barbarum]